VSQGARREQSGWTRRSEKEGEREGEYEGAKKREAEGEYSAGSSVAQGKAHARGALICNRPRMRAMPGEQYDHR